MDDRNGNIYPDWPAALAAGVPADHAHEVEAVYGELLRITSGPFKGRVYRRTANGLERVDGKESR